MHKIRKRITEIVIPWEKYISLIGDEKLNRHKGL